MSHLGPTGSSSGSPHRLQPGTSPHALRIPPHDGHPALRRTAGDGSRSALACFRLSLSCPFRLLHTCHLLRPARHYPRVRIQRPSFERRRDFNPPEQCAAQRTLRPVLTSPPFSRRRSPQVRRCLFPFTPSGSTMHVFVWTSGFALASTLTARTRPLCRFVFLRSKVCSPLPSASPRGYTLRFPTVTSIGPGEFLSTHEKQPMLGTLARTPVLRSAALPSPH